MTARPSPLADPLLNSIQAADLLGVSREWVAENAAELGGVKIGRAWTFTRGELHAYRERLRPVPKAAPAPIRRRPTRLSVVADLGEINEVTRMPWGATR